MSRNITVPDDLYEKVAKLAAERDVAVDDIIATAIADQMAAQEYFARRASRSSKEAFIAALDQIGDAETDDRDRL